MVRRTRVLILCADIGEGHVTVARALAERLRRRAEVEAVDMINFDTSVAHLRAHARAMAGQGYAEFAPDRDALAAALPRALARLALDALPEAADLILQVAHPRREVR